MGSIFKKNNNYYINIMVDGKRIKKKIGTSKKIALLALKDYEVKIARKEFDFTIPDTNLEIIFQSYTEYSETHHAPSSTKRYKNVIRNFEIYLALYAKNIKKVSQLNTQVFEKYKHFRKTIDPRTIKLPNDFPFIIKNNSFTAKTKTLNYEIKTLRSIFNFAIRNRFCKENPLKDVVTLKINDASVRLQTIRTSVIES